LRWCPCFVPMLLLLALPSLTPSKQGVIVTAVSEGEANTAVPLSHSLLLAFAEHSYHSRDSEGERKRS
jgi:hypothetical protein